MNTDNLNKPDPMAEDELDKILDSQFTWFVPPNDEGKWKSYAKRKDLALAAINAYTTNKIIEQVEAIYDEYALGGKDEFEFGKWLKAKLAELKEKGKS